ncbi:MAG: hypothetical protein NTX50_23735 [Candidatus Sumerlaeota bacterium]|nr:hypothetical protein [Candidatus Sumerlaeota bacterium]
MTGNFGKLAECIVTLWMAAGGFLFVLAWLSIPILIVFAAHRFVQLHDARHDLRVTAPTHAALHFLCAGLYGVFFPVYYLLSTRFTSELAIWDLGRGTNTRWSFGLAMACLGWLAAHLIEALARRGAIRFSRHWIDRGFALVGFGLFVRYQILMLEQGLIPKSQGGPDIQESVWIILIGRVIPQLLFGGASLVFGFACIEAFFGRSNDPIRRRWKAAIPLACALIAAMLSPLWLSVPRTTPSQALKAIEENRTIITEVAHRAQIEPALLAGIVYAAQTRDRPRWTGRILETASAHAWDSQHWLRRGVKPAINAPGGLAQIRPLTAIQTCYLVGIAGGFSYGMPTSSPSPKTDVHIERFLDYAWDRLMVNNTSLKHINPSIPHNPEILFILLREHSSNGRMEEMLLKPEMNLTLAVGMLALLRQQWRAEGYPIGDRPDILASVYRNGYELSHPHSNPAPNEFGRRVAEFMKSEYCRKFFNE